MWHKVNRLHTLTRDSWHSLFTWHYLCHKCSCQIQNELYYSCRCLWFMCQLEFATRYQNYYLNGKPCHSDTPQMQSTVHVAWVNYSYMVTRKSISDIFDKAEWNVSRRRQQKLNRPTHIYWNVGWKKSEWVTRREMMKIGKKAQPHPLRWLQQNGWLMSCFAMWLLFIVGKYFWCVVFVPFSPSSLPKIHKSQSAKQFPVASPQADFLYDQRYAIKCFFMYFRFTRGL